jgi:hypothetical protein
MRAWVGILGAAAVLFAAETAVGSPALEQVRVLNSNAEGIEAEVVFPEPAVRTSPDHPEYNLVSLGSLDDRGEPGEPSIPRVSFWIALPPGMAATVTAAPSDEMRWERIRPIPVPHEEWRDAPGENGRNDAEALPVSISSFVEDPAIYQGGTWPREAATIGAETRLRYQRIAPVTIYPARWDPASGTLLVARKVNVTIAFRPDRSRRAVAERTIGRDDPSWERSYDGLIVNGEQARGWGRAPLAERRARGFADFGPRAKFEVKTTGLKKVPFADLPNAAAFDGAPISDLRLYELWNDTNDVRPDSTTEVPIDIVDADGSTTWNSGDVLYFYGQNLYDRRPDLPWYVKRYGRMHAYFLGLRSGVANARMAQDSSFVRSDPLPLVTSYPWTEHFEQEKYAYMKLQSREDLDDLQAGASAVRTKHFYWSDGGPFDYLLQNGTDTIGVTNWYVQSFDLPGYKTGTAPTRLAAHFQGIAPPSNGSRHRVFMSVPLNASDWRDFRNQQLLPHTPLLISNVQDSARYVADEADLATTALRETNNHFCYYERDSAYGAGLNWFEIRYLREPRFLRRTAGDPSTWTPVQIATKGLTGESEFQVRFFTLPLEELIGFETTDPLAPKRFTLRQEQVQGTNLRLQWVLDGSDRRFTVSTISSIPKPEAITESTGNDLLSSTDADYIVIVPRMWTTVIQPLVDHRTTQGHRVLVAPIEDVYDQFSGGRHWPHAVRSFMRALFRVNGIAPSFLLLAGDASDVFDNPLISSEDEIPMSSPNFVPTQTVYSSSFKLLPELVASDQWFVDNLTGTGERLNFIPDMHVGRIPAGDATQLQNVVQKIISYESFGQNDSWRNRALFVSDDEWSSRIGFSGPYTRNWQDEPIFAAAGDSAIKIIEDEGVQCAFRTSRFFIGTILDTVRTPPPPPTCYGLPNRCITYNADSSRCVQFRTSDVEANNSCYGGTVIRGRLLSEINRGNLIVSYVGHSNSHLMTHEMILVDYQNARNDVSQMGNLSMPFVYMGFGCHLNEFSRYEEALSRVGDGMTEDMIVRFPDRGAIASIASSAYEWISSSDVYSLKVMRSFFRDPPQFQGHSRWVLGEVFSKSKVAVRPASYGASQSMTYNLLGDPGLVMDGAPPRLTMAANGDTLADGEPLVLAADQDSIRFEGRVCDEIWAKSIQVSDAYGSGALDTTRTGDDREITIVYRTTVLPRDYDLRFTADDGNGRRAILTFPARVSRTYEIKKPGRDWIALGAAELVLPDDSIRVRIILPRYLQAGDIDVLMDGVAVPRRATGSGMAGDRARDWTFTYLQMVPLDRAVSLGIRVQQPDGSLPFEPPPVVTAEAAFQITGLYNVPNPFAKETWIFYGLGIQVDEAILRIYTASGRLIRTFPLDTRHSLSNPPLYWDGTDADGDQIGNGLYYCKLTAKAYGKTVSKIEKLARVK